MSNIKLFESKQIRFAWNEADNKWYCSVADVVETMTDTTNVRGYIKKMRKREPELNANRGTICPPLNYGLQTASVDKSTVNCRRSVDGYIEPILEAS